MQTVGANAMHEEDLSNAASDASDAAQATVDALALTAKADSPELLVSAYNDPFFVQKQDVNALDAFFRAGPVQTPKGH